jgi:hypothetical protein
MADSGYGETNSANTAAESTPLLNKSPERQHSVTSEKTRKKFIMITFAIIYITMSASYSVIAPFFPTEVSGKFINKWFSGVNVMFLYVM